MTRLDADEVRAPELAREVTFHDPRLNAAFLADNPCKRGPRQDGGGTELPSISTGHMPVPICGAIQQDAQRSAIGGVPRFPNRPRR